MLSSNTLECKQPGFDMTHPCILSHNEHLSALHDEVLTCEGDMCPELSPRLVLADTVTALGCALRILSRCNWSQVYKLHRSNTCQAKLTDYMLMILRLLLYTSHHSLSNQRRGSQKTKTHQCRHQRRKQSRYGHTWCFAVT